MSTRNFFNELKRRNVYKVAVAYAVVGWLLVQIATQVFPFLEIPNWVVRMVIGLVAIGFPIAVVIAWAFELTPEGIKRTEDVDPARKRTRSHAWIYIVLIGAAVSIGLFLAGRFTAGNARTPLQSEATTVSKKSIAVLPFENLSDDKSAAYFADGIQDEILTKLASVADLKVISRTSTAKYKSKPEDLKTVSQQLRIANVLEGTVQRAGDKVRINVQLIDARADSHLWAKSYDRDFQDVLKVESEIAAEIAETLQAKLSPAESTAVALVPTSDSQAYDLFLKAEYLEHQAENNLTDQLFEQARDYYQRALTLDPKFSLAYARLAYAGLNRHWFIGPLSSAEMAEVKSLIDRALTLAPDSADGHLALAVYHYWGFLHYEAALDELRRTTELRPNSGDARQFTAWIHRRMGHWERSLVEARKAQELSPRDASIPHNIGWTLTALRKYSEAEQELRRALELEPDILDAARALSDVYINSSGDMQRARQAFVGVPLNLKSSSNDWGKVDVLINQEVYLDVLERNFAKALEAWANLVEDTPDARLRQLAARAAIQVVAGQSAAVKADCAQACPLLEAKMAREPNDRQIVSALGWVYVCLGRNQDAVRVAQHGVDVLPIEKDALSGVFMVTGLAQIQAQTGHVDEAIELLRRLLSIPAGHAVSIARLKIDPVWDPIRSHPGFQKLLTGPEQVGSNK